MEPVCCRFVGRLNDVASLAILGLPDIDCAEGPGRPNLMFAAWARFRQYWHLLTSRSQSPSSKTNRLYVIGDGGSLACSRCPITGRKLWWSTAVATQPFQKAQPPQASIHGELAQLSGSVGATGQDLMVTSPERKLRVGKAPCSCAQLQEAYNSIDPCQQTLPLPVRLKQAWKGNISTQRLPKILSMVWECLMLLIATCDHTLDNRPITEDLLLPTGKDFSESE